MIWLLVYVVGLLITALLLCSFMTEDEEGAVCVYALFWPFWLLFYVILFIIINVAILFAMLCEKLER